MSVNTNHCQKIDAIGDIGDDHVTVSIKRVLEVADGISTKEELTYSVMSHLYGHIGHGSAGGCEAICSEVRDALLSVSEGDGADEAIALTSFVEGAFHALVSASLATEDQQKAAEREIAFSAAENISFIVSLDINTKIMY